MSQALAPVRAPAMVDRTTRSTSSALSFPDAIALASDRQYSRAARTQKFYVDQTPYDLEGHLLHGQLWVQAGDNDNLITLFNNARDDLCTISGQPGR